MIHDEVVTLSPFEREDAAQALQWVNDSELCRSLDRVLPVTRYEHERWYEALVAKSDAVTFAIRRAGKTIGVCGLSKIHARHRSAELWIYIGPSASRGMGYGSRTVTLACRFAFERLNLHRVGLYVAAYNHSAIAAYRGCGFVEEGREREAIFMDGEYHDALRMGLLRSDLAVTAASTTACEAAEIRSGSDTLSRVS